MMYTDGAQCTADFVHTDGAGNDYVGYAAHCAGTGAATDTNGCDAGSLPLGSPVSFREGGSLVSGGTEVGTGKLAYSSWPTMQQKNETDANACDYNDFALVKVDAAYVNDVNPSIPFWGGPVGVNTTGTQTGDQTHMGTPRCGPASRCCHRTRGVRRTSQPARCCNRRCAGGARRDHDGTRGCGDPHGIRWHRRAVRLRRLASPPPAQRGQAERADDNDQRRRRRRGQLASGSRSPP